MGAEGLLLRACAFPFYVKFVVCLLYPVWMAFSVSCLPFPGFYMRFIIYWFCPSIPVTIFSHKLSSFSCIANKVVFCSCFNLVPFYYKVTIIRLFRNVSPS